MKRNKKLNTLLIIATFVVLNACSQDPHEKFVGMWAKEGEGSLQAVKIINDDGDYKMLSDILDADKQELDDLIKDSESFLVKYKSYAAAPINTTTESNVITINEKPYRKVNDAEIESLKVEKVQAETKHKNEITGRKLTMSIQEFYLDTGSYPNELNELKDDTGDTMWMGPYVRASDLTDTWGNPFYYETDEKTFTLIALGKDNKKGGDGVNADHDFRYQ